MSSDPAAQAVRQRQSNINDASSSAAPASLSTDSNKKVPRDKPKVKPPFANVSMNKFLVNLSLVLFAIFAFYAWRVTVWAQDAGGYWALITGNPNTAAALKTARDAAESASASGSAVKHAASSASSASSLAGKASNIPGHKSKTTVATGSGSGLDDSTDVQSAVLHLAHLLGCSPSDLTTAIRPFIDPSVPNPVEEARRIREQVEAHGAAGAAGVAGGKAEQVVDEEEIKKKAEEASGPGLMHLIEEAFLD